MDPRPWEDRGIRWRLTIDRLSQRQANAVRVFRLFAEGRSDAEIIVDDVLAGSLLEEV